MCRMYRGSGSATGKSATGSLESNTARDHQRRFRPELSLGLLRDNIGMQLVQSVPIPTKGHVANPVGLATCPKPC